jgi:hypothetical protein
MRHPDRRLFKSGLEALVDFFDFGRLGEEATPDNGYCDQRARGDKHNHEGEKSRFAQDLFPALFVMAVLPSDLGPCLSRKMPGDPYV